VARLNHTFTISVPPEQAKEEFQEEIGPDLRRDGGFQIAHDGSRRLVYSDGIVSPEPAPLGGYPTNWNTYARLRRLLARRITVEFVPEGAGTKVSLRGSVERGICTGLEELGSPGHWPGNREQVRARREAEEAEG
jgi:hypothetical protein